MCFDSCEVAAPCDPSLECLGETLLGKGKGTVSLISLLVTLPEPSEISCLVITGLTTFVFSRIVGVEVGSFNLCGEFNGFERGAKNGIKTRQETTQ